MRPIDDTVTDQLAPVADGVRLHLRRRPGQRTGFLLVHGLSSNARLWDEVAAELAAAGHPSTAVDLRSHGESDAPAAGYDTATAVADLAALELGRVIVAGQSWGGNVAVGFAARYPDQVAALALIDGGWIEPRQQYPDWPACLAALRPPDIDGLPADQLRQRLRAGHPDWSDRAVEATLASLRITADGTVRRRLAIPAHLGILRDMWDDPVSRHFPAVIAPVLLMPALPADPAAATARLATVRRAAAALPDATIREYPGADHDLHAQHPHEVATDLLRLAALVEG